MRIAATIAIIAIGVLTVGFQWAGIGAAREAAEQHCVGEWGIVTELVADGTEYPIQQSGIRCLIVPPLDAPDYYTTRPYSSRIYSLDNGRLPAAYEWNDGLRMLSDSTIVRASINAAYPLAGFAALLSIIAIAYGTWRE